MARSRALPLAKPSARHRLAVLCSLVPCLRLSVFEACEEPPVFATDPPSVRGNHRVQGQVLALVVEERERGSKPPLAFPVLVGSHLHFIFIDAVPDKGLPDLQPFDVVGVHDELPHQAIAHHAGELVLV